MKRRLVLQAGTALAGLSASGLALAQQYPSRPIKLVVPWPAAGVTDIVARVVGEKLQAELGQPVVVENKAGANGFIGTEYVAKAAPDGYTLLLMTTSTHVVAPNLYRKLPYDPIKDFAPISQITAAPTIMVAPPNSPHKDVAALIAYAKANPKKLNYATYGAGGSSQLAAALFMQAADIDMTPIPYKGSAPAIVGLMAGECDVFFDSIPASLGHVKNGKLKALAVTSQKRVEAAPEIPTVAETFPGFEFIVWQGVEAPAGTPKAVVDRLSAAIIKVIDQPEVKAKFNGLGAMGVSSPTPEHLAQQKVREKDKMGTVIKRANIGYLD
ncbi:Bug family tripartite tricarboxylate transporter substrate binding protein [Ramlibacter albus]|uniref:Tripartite tricarboxylate transporter substrate binding protein n=1 Tax=Ramlibacter albus TaxID=2079448 RepID=A0A923S5E3_9BURK|nr:tripartite tricarboxylate transporter substrate binding protein [Ramlibacter albus]MBC5767888.1 tripartite tricarboxylate transporter substrate binding protein [Ramlibacter albus]